MNFISIVADSASLYNDHNLFQTSQANEQTRHEKELELMRQQHEYELTAAKQAYLINAFTNIEQYCQELNENLINSTRDAERDMVDQRNQQYQTILVASTVMLTALFTVLVQGRLPVVANQAVKLTFAISTAVSTGFIIVNVLLCIQLIYRVSQFMYRKTEDHLQKINGAIDSTRRTMKKLHGMSHLMFLSFMIMIHHLYFYTSIFIRLPITIKYTILGTHSSEQPYFAKLAGPEIDCEWGSHEKKVHGHLEERNKLIVLRETIMSEAIPFHKFWDDNCKSIGSTALICFYIGAAFMLIATMIYMWSWYIYTYKNYIGAIIGLVIMLLSLIVTMTIAIYLRYFDPTIINLSQSISDHPVFETTTTETRKPLERYKRSKNKSSVSKMK